MIFVTVGLAPQPFYRLVKAMDEIAADLDEEIVMQIGHTDYEPRYAKFVRFLSGPDFEESVARARIVICHDGAGSIRTALSLGKPTMVLPRMLKYGELGYDNKLDLAKALAERGMITLVYEAESLRSILKEADSVMPGVGTHRGRLVERLKELLQHLDGRSTGPG